MFHPSELFARVYVTPTSWTLMNNIFAGIQAEWEQTAASYTTTTETIENNLLFVSIQIVPFSWKQLFNIQTASKLTKT